MGLKNSGKLHERAAPYFRAYPAATATDIDLTEAVANARCATSGLLVTGTGNLVIEDASGTEITQAVTGAILVYVPLAAVRLDADTTVDVIAYWHPRGAAS